MRGILSGVYIMADLTVPCLVLFLCAFVSAQQTTPPTTATPGITTASPGMTCDFETFYTKLGECNSVAMSAVFRSTETGMSEAQCLMTSGDMVTCVGNLITLCAGEEVVRIMEKYFSMAAMRAAMEFACRNLDEMQTINYCMSNSSSPYTNCLLNEVGDMLKNGIRTDMSFLEEIICRNIRATINCAKPALENCADMTTYEDFVTKMYPEDCSWLPSGAHVHCTYIGLVLSGAVIAMVSVV